MKVAEVKYVGRRRRERRRGPSGEEYVFHNSTSGAVPVPVESVRDAEAFVETGVFEVEWTALGEVVKATDAPTTDAEAMLSRMGYRQKQKLAKKLGIKANKDEESLEDELEPAIEQLREHMENQ